jgi:hypothetical protein
LTDFLDGCRTLFIVGFAVNVAGHSGCGKMAADRLTYPNDQPRLSES